MTKPLLVILGAGASHDCTERRPGREHMPPLAADLFAEEYRAVWDRYPLVQAAVADLSATTACQVETFL